MGIVEALKGLDPFNDDHWTEDGSPRVDKVSELVGENVTRQQIVEAAPRFTKDNMELPEEPEEEPEQPADDAPLSDLTEDQLYELQETKREEVNAAVRARDEAERLRRVKKRELNLVGVEIQNRYPDQDNQSAIQEFIRSQAQVREQNAQTLNRIAEAVGTTDMSNFDPRSRLDQSMARQTKRGTKRPNKV